MKCRKVIYNKDHYDIVHFGSYGLENPYAILFNMSNDQTMPDDIQIINDIIFNDNNFVWTHTYYQDENICTIVTITLNSISIQDNNILTNISLQIEKHGLAKDVNISLYCRYYTKEMYDARYSSIVVNKTLPNENGTYDIEFPVLQMSKKWNDGTTSYANKQEGVASSLIQRLSIIQGDLWEDKDYGLPLFSKVKDKFIFDSIIINTILKHPDVRGIISYESNIDVKSTNHGLYMFTAVIESIYNEAITINSSTMI